MTISQPKEIADIKREAVLLCQNGRFQQAQELLEKLGQQQRFDAEACSLLATIYGQLGDFNKAIDAYRDGIKLQSNAPQMHFGLGKALARQGLFSEAEDSYKRALDLQPSFTQSIPDLAVALFQQNKLTESEHYFQEALRSDPKSVKAMLGLGRIYQIWRKAELATNYYKNALTINPNIALAEHQLGHMAMLAAQHEEADKHLEAALKIDPNYAPAYLELGDLRIICNRIDEAKAAYQAAISISPDYTSAIVGIAKVYELSGDTQAAYDQIEPLIERGIKDIGLGVVFANICRHFGLCQDAIDYLEEILADLQEGVGFIDQIHFSLGKLYDAQGEYDKAFMHFAEGNRPKSDTFNPVEHTAYIDSVIQTCDWSFFIKAPRTSRKSQRPVFIIGMPRSGTTLTEQILSSHPDIYGAGELPIIPKIIKNLPSILGGSYPENLNRLTKNILDTLCDDYHYEIEKLDEHATIVVDKSLVNFLYLGLISLMLPEARIIHCVRDPRDTCLSIYFQNFDESHNYATRLENLGHYYREYKRIMQHWKSLLDMPFLEVHYEDMVNNQESMSRKLIDFVGLDWDERVLRFYDSRRSVVTASYDQVRQKIYTKSTRRWKNYEAHIQPLVTALGDAV